MRLLVMLFVAVLMAQPAWSSEIAGVTLEDEVTVSDGVTLHLNGAGIRKKFFIKVYIGQLYLENPASQAEAVIADGGHKRVVLHFLYKEVGKDTLIEGWNEGFAGNLKPEVRAALQPQIDAFNAMFDEDVVAGDTIVFDYLPEQGTVVTFKGKERGIIEGKAFNDALLSIWMGDSPPTSDLKEGMLGQ